MNPSRFEFNSVSGTLYSTDMWSKFLRYNILSEGELYTIRALQYYSEILSSHQFSLRVVNKSGYTFKLINGKQI
jgi:hypothetical protein